MERGNNGLFVDKSGFKLKIPFISVLLVILLLTPVLIQVNLAKGSPDSNTSTGQNLIYNDRDDDEPNLQYESNNKFSWIKDFDMTSDSQTLFSEAKRNAFSDIFQKIEVSLIKMDYQENVKANSYAQHFGHDLSLAKQTRSKLLRVFDQPDMQFKHEFNKLEQEQIGLKQTVIIQNLETMDQEYIIKFRFQSPYETLLIDGQQIILQNEPIELNSVNHEIELLDSNGVSTSIFNWEDLIIESFSPSLNGYFKSGTSTIECSLEIIVPAGEELTVDPAYLVKNVAELRLYHEEKYAYMGTEMVVGDFNNDGYDDLAIVAPEASSGPDDDRFQAGEVYILYGKSRKDLGKDLNFSYSEDVVIYGKSDEYSLLDASLAAGDINNDGYDDLLIGTPKSNYNQGHAYVIFGGNNISNVLDLATAGHYSIKITGPDEYSLAGYACAIGDINGDGFGDIIVSAPQATFPTNLTGKDAFDRQLCGIIFVIYGNTTMESTYRLNLKDEDPQYDMKILGEDVDDRIGMSLATGDINSDGLDDLVIGSPKRAAGIGRKRNFAGHVDVIFGSKSLPELWDLRNYNISAAKLGLLNTNITIIGADNNDEIGTFVEIAKVDNDEYDDILIGVPNGNGKEGFRYDSGEVYIIYGDSEEDLKKHIDAKNMSRDGYVIYGKDVDDDFGAAIAAKDVDSDGISELIIGAPGGQGIADDARESGESYLIYGEPDKKFGFLEVETILGTPNIEVLYGNRELEKSGSAIAIGDLDKDGKNDIIISAPEADSLNGSIFVVGRIDIVFQLIVTPRIKHLSLELLDGGGQNKTICYAGKEHTFRVTVFNSLGANNINFTQLNIEPSGPNVRLKWFQGNNTFFEIPESGKVDYATLNSSACKSKRINNTIYQLDFVVHFNFSYPSHFKSSCLLFSLDYNVSIPAALDQYKEIFYVETHLDFVGDLEVTGSSQGILEDGDRVQSNEIITWSGLTVVFNGTTNIFPKDEYFDVAVYDDDDNFWVDEFSSGKEIAVESRADINDDNKDIHIIKIINIAGNGKALSQFSFSVEVVSTKIVFTNPTPTPNVWHKNTIVTCGITVSDESNWDINGGSIEYSISTSGDSPNNFDAWISAGATGEKLSFEITVDPEFENGMDNYIRWRVKNQGSEIFSGSNVYQIRVDIEPVYYSNPTPDHITWQYEINVKCTIEIYDNYSGVDKDSISYRTSKSGKTGYSDWQSSNIVFTNINTQSSSGNTVNGYQCKVSVDFQAGNNNFIQWIAEDDLENSGVLSAHNNVKVTLNEPISILTTPKDYSKVNDIDIRLEWTGKDPNDDQMLYSIYVGTDDTKVKSLDNSVRMAENINQTYHDLSGLSNGEIYYWTVIPFDGENIGECQVGVWSFEIDLYAPIANLILPINNSIVTSTDVECIWHTDFKGNEEIKYNLYLSNINPPTDKDIIAPDITGNSYILTNLDDGKTYYWFVIPKVKSGTKTLTGSSKPNVMRFTLNTGKNPPKVDLNEPNNNKIITILQPVLKWTLDYNGEDRGNVRFIILFGSDPNPSNILIQNLGTTQYTFNKQLEYNKTYYWRIIPILNDIQGVHSEIWMFKTTSVDPEFEILIEFDSDNFEIEAGKEGIIHFTITNLAKITDNINIEPIMAGAPIFNITINLEITSQPIVLAPGEAESGKIKIKAPKDIEIKMHVLTLEAISVLASDYGLFIRTTETVNVTFIEQKDTETDGGIMFTMVILVIIVIMLFIIVLIASRRKKTSKKDDSEKADDTPEKKSKTKPKKPSGQAVKTKTKTQSKKMKDLDFKGKNSKVGTKRK